MYGGRHDYRWKETGADVSQIPPRGPWDGRGPEQRGAAEREFFCDDTSRWWCLFCGVRLMPAPRGNLAGTFGVLLSYRNCEHRRKNNATEGIAFGCIVSERKKVATMTENSPPPAIVIAAGLARLKGGALHLTTAPSSVAAVETETRRRDELGSDAATSRCQTRASVSAVINFLDSEIAL
jgi:hypothetical protein